MSKLDVCTIGQPSNSAVRSIKGVFIANMNFGDTEISGQVLTGPIMAPLLIVKANIAQQFAKEKIFICL